MLQKIICVFVLSISLFSCLEPYDVNVSDYEDLLVVDALITDEAKNHRVYLSRSVPNLDETPEVESGALVVITDENNVEEVLTEISPGVYETDQLQFVARIGGTYTLSIITRNGDKYRSSPCTILPVTNIDNVHFKAGKEWNSDKTTELLGINILVDGRAFEGGYVRWMYDEDWKFRTPFPSRMRYDYSIDDWEYILPENNICWKDNESDEVVIHSFSNQNQPDIKNWKVCFVPSETTDKLTVRYSINVKQLSISQDEYEFWNKLKISTEGVGDVFGTQPFSISGNITNIADDKEPVLGYFQTGSVVSKRIFINRKEITEMGLPVFRYDQGCRLDTIKVDGMAYTSALEIYEKLVLTGAYSLFDAVYAETGFGISGLLLTNPVCSDCTLTGESQQPDFWEE